MPYKEYTVYGKCRNCGAKVNLGSFPEADSYFCEDISWEDTLLAVANNKVITKLHKCDESNLGIVELICFKEKE